MRCVLPEYDVGEVGPQSVVRNGHSLSRWDLELGGWSRVQPHALEEVGPVERRPGDLHDHLRLSFATASPDELGSAVRRLATVVRVPPGADVAQR